nr:hypothetical protein [Tanacetum cinerariifolium]
MYLPRELRHTEEIKSLNNVAVDHMYQPWRIFVALINKSLSRNTTGLDKLCLSRAQILWGMYHQKNVDYVELLWEDFIYQIDNRAFKKKKNITYEEVKESKDICKKVYQGPSGGVVIRETPEMHVSKKKEKMNVLRGKGIELLSKVALTKEAQIDKSYKLDKNLFSTYDKVYSLKRSKKDKDKDEDPFAGSDRGLKKRKTSKDAEPTKGEPEFDVIDSDMPQDREENPSNDYDESMKETAIYDVCREVYMSAHQFIKGEPEFDVIDSDMPQDREENPSNDYDESMKKTTAQQGPTESWLMTLAFSAYKPSKTFDELMSTHIDFSTYIINGLKITNLTQETLLGIEFRLLKGIRINYAELKYDFEECYKALFEKLDWENLKGGDYPFDLTKPLPLVKNGNSQVVLVDYFFKNDLKYLQGGI